MRQSSRLVTFLIVTTIFLVILLVYNNGKAGEQDFESDLSTTHNLTEYSMNTGQDLGRNLSTSDNSIMTTEDSTKICGNFLCVTVLHHPPGVGYFPLVNSSGHFKSIHRTEGFRYPTDKRRKLINVYFPTIPRTGNTYTRKLWEAVTHVSSQSVFREHSNVDRRSGGYLRPCGGISIHSRGGGGGGGDADQCKRIRAGKGLDPILLKSHDKSHVKMFHLARSSHILLLVRNPVDNYVSDIVDRFMLQKNPEYRSTGNMARITVKGAEPIASWVRMHYLHHLNIWLGTSRSYPCFTKPRNGMNAEEYRATRKSCARKILPVYIMRYEDLYHNNIDAMHSFLGDCGVLQKLNISTDQLTQRIKELDTLAGGRPTTMANSKHGFDFVAPTHRRALRVLRMLNSKKVQPHLRAFGYEFSLRRHVDGERRESSSHTR